MNYITKKTTETEKVGRLLAEKLDTAGVKRAFIALRGEMGVGKTAFTRGFASYFDINSVKSPTYTIVNEYRGKKNIFHFDMYRIESEDDLYSIDFDGYVYRDGFSIAEWSENITEFLPDDVIFVTIGRSDADTDTRNIEIDFGEKYDYLSI